ncbi:MAG TPA: hypothetical protein VGB32_00215 [Candidatus Bathyarchaeia archaeon]
MKPKKIPTTLDHVVFPEDIRLTHIDSEETPFRRSNVDIQKILQESIKKKLEFKESKG